MNIIISYESSWRNSFLDGNNNEPLPKNGRKFIASLTNLKKSENHLRRDVTIDTVMGLLNRLIGDQRKLYQSRTSKDYYFKDIEKLVSFKDKPKVTSHEMVYIRNVSGSTDQNSYTGMIKTGVPLLLSDYSTELWGVIDLSFDELLDFILDDKPAVAGFELEPLTILNILETLNKLKPVEKQDKVARAFEYLSTRFPKFNGLNNKGRVLPISLYCSSLYLQLDRLGTKHDISTAITKSGAISGISNNGFTKKDFMSRFTTGDKKKIWGNPYIREEFEKGEGKSQVLMKKQSGQLEININVDRGKANEIRQLIDNAGVSTFYLGKKGLAYVSRIRS